MIKFYAQSKKKNFTDKVNISFKINNYLKAIWKKERRNSPSKQRREKKRFIIFARFSPTIKPRDCVRSGEKNEWAESSELELALNLNSAQGVDSRSEWVQRLGKFFESVPPERCVNSLEIPQRSPIRIIENYITGRNVRELRMRDRRATCETPEFIATALLESSSFPVPPFLSVNGPFHSVPTILPSDSSQTFQSVEKPHQA